jgi:ribosome-binding protein aMBF1 (putative translation factor)
MILKARHNGIPTRGISPMAKTADALKMLDHLDGDDPALQQMIAQETLHVHIARMIYEARTEAGLTQQQLAHLIGTTQSVISRLEDADYDGHSLTMLLRVAEALNKRLDIRLIDKEPVSA